MCPLIAVDSRQTGAHIFNEQEILGPPDMRYDLKMIFDLSEEIGLRCVSQALNKVAIELEPSVVLVFQNFDSEDDCLMYFQGTDWHAHGDLMCADRHGYYIDLSYLDVLTGAADGTVLLCELWCHEELADRRIVHRDYVDEFQYMQVGEEIRIRPLGSRKAAD